MSKGGLKLYASYNFRNKDPAIDELRTLISDEYGTRKLTARMYKDIELQGGPTASCLHEWFEGKTKRPQNATLEAAGRALGKKRVWVDDTETTRKALPEGRGPTTEPAVPNKGVKKKAKAKAK